MAEDRNTGPKSNDRPTTDKLYTYFFWNNGQIKLNKQIMRNIIDGTAGVNTATETGKYINWVYTKRYCDELLRSTSIMNDLLQNYTTNKNSVIINTQVVETEVDKYYNDKNNMTFCQAYYYDTNYWKDKLETEMAPIKEYSHKKVLQKVRDKIEVVPVSHFSQVLNDKNKHKYPKLIKYLQNAGRMHEKTLKIKKIRKKFNSLIEKKYFEKNELQIEFELSINIAKTEAEKLRFTEFNSKNVFRWIAYCAYHPELQSDEDDQYFYDIMDSGSGGGESKESIKEISDYIAAFDDYTGNDNQYLNFLCRKIIEHENFLENNKDFLEKKLGFITTAYDMQSQYIIDALKIAIAWYIDNKRMFNATAGPTSVQEIWNYNNFVPPTDFKKKLEKIKTPERPPEPLTKYLQLKKQNWYAYILGEIKGVYTSPFLIKPKWLEACDTISRNIRKLNAEVETFQKQIFRRQLSSLELLDLSSLKYINVPSKLKRDKTSTDKTVKFYDTFDNTIFRKYSDFDLRSVWSDVFTTVNKRGHGDIIDKYVDLFYKIMCKWMVIHMIDKYSYKKTVPEPKYCVQNSSDRNSKGVEGSTFLIFPGYLVVANNPNNNYRKNLLKKYLVSPDGGEMVDFYITKGNVVKRHYNVSPYYATFRIGSKSIKFIYASREFAKKKGIKQGVYQVYRIYTPNGNPKDIRVIFVASTFIDEPVIPQDIYQKADGINIVEIRKPKGKGLSYGAKYILKNTDGENIKSESVDYNECTFSKKDQQPETIRKRPADGSPSEISNNVNPSLLKTPNNKSSPINTNSPRSKEFSVGERGKRKGFEVVLATPQFNWTPGGERKESPGSDVSQEEDGAEAWGKIMKDMRKGGESKNSSGSSISPGSDVSQEEDGAKAWRTIMKDMRKGGERKESPGSDAPRLPDSPSQVRKPPSLPRLSSRTLRFFGDSPPQAPSRGPPEPLPKKDKYIKLRF